LKGDCKFKEQVAYLLKNKKISKEISKGKYKKLWHP
jgi:hypothetical protein